MIQSPDDNVFVLWQNDTAVTDKFVVLPHRNGVNT